MSSSIAARTARGAGWVMLWRLATRGIGLASTLVLTRVLLPGDFGVVALATTVAASVDLLSWIGVQEMLIRLRTPGRASYDTAFTLSVIRALLTGVIIAALAQPIARFMNEPRAAALILTLAAGAALSGFENIGIADFRRDLAFEKEFQLMILPRLLGAVAGVVAAIVLRSCWALIIGILVTRVLRLGYSYAVHPFRPRLGLSEWRTYLHFSLWAWAGAMVAMVRDRSDTFVVGRILGAAQLGIYSVGQEIAFLPISEVLESLGRALFSGFVATEQEGGSAGPVFVRVTGLVGIVIIPASVGLSAVAGPLVRTFLGPGWEGTVIVIETVALVGLLRVFGHVGITLLVSGGAPKVTTRIAWFSASLRVALLIWLVQTAGLFGVALALLLSIAFEDVLLIVAICRRYRLQPTDLLVQTWRSLLAASLMAALLWGCGLGWSAMPTALETALSRLSMGVALGATAYGLALVGLWCLSRRPRAAETEVLGLLAMMARRPKPSHLTG